MLLIGLVRGWLVGREWPGPGRQGVGGPFLMVALLFDPAIRTRRPFSARKGLAGWTKGRRYLLCLIMCGIVTTGGSMEAAETPILVNHAGLVLAAGKYCVVKGSDPSDFVVVDVATQKTALKCGGWASMPTWLKPSALCSCCRSTLERVRTDNQDNQALCQRPVAGKYEPWHGRPLDGIRRLTQVSETEMRPVLTGANLFHYRVAFSRPELRFRPWNGPQPELRPTTLQRKARGTGMRPGLTCGWSFC
jgi:hypothetical protein